MDQTGTQLLPSTIKSALFRLCLINLILFGAVITYQFVFWDDPLSVTQNRDLLQNWTLDNTGWLFDADTTLRIMTVVWFIRKAVLSLFGLEPSAFHGINLIAHLAAVTFLFLFLKNLLQRTGSSARGALRMSFFVTLLWSIDPLRVEPVAWVTAQSYPIAATFAFAAFYCLERSWHAENGSGIAWIMGMFFAALLSVLSYPIALFIPFVLLLFGAFAYSSGFDSWQGPKRWVTLASYALLLGLSAFVLFETFQTTAEGAGNMASADGAALPAVTKLVMGLRNYGYYATAIAFPYPITPARFYPLATEFGLSEIILTSCVFAALLGVAIKLLFRHKIQLVFLFSWLALTLPVLGLTTHYVFPSDRYTYLSHAFLWILIAIVGSKFAQDHRAWFNRAKKYLYIVIAIFVVTSVWQTYPATRIWKDNIELYGHMLSRESNYDFKALVKILAAREFISNQEPALAITVLEDLDPNQIQAPDLLIRALGLAEILDMESKIAELQKRLAPYVQ